MNMENAAQPVWRELYDDINIRIFIEFTPTGVPLSSSPLPPQSACAPPPTPHLLQSLSSPPIGIGDDVQLIAGWLLTMEPEKVYLQLSSLPCTLGQSSFGRSRVQGFFPSWVDKNVLLWTA
jgi:hypothetical protein